MNDIILSINVTNEHINKGVRDSAYSCPVALATKEALHDLNIPYLNVEVGPDFTTIITEGLIRLDAPNPENVMTFIGEFDYSGDPQPFSTTFKFEGC